MIRPDLEHVKPQIDGVVEPLRAENSNLPVPSLVHMTSQSGHGGVFLQPTPAVYDG